MDEAIQVVNQQAKFTLQWPGDTKPGVPIPLDVALHSFRDEPEVLEWLKSAQVGGSLITGGGATPRCSLRRVE